MLKLVNNLNEENHLKTIKELSYEAEEIIFVSPYIYGDFRDSFEDLKFKSLRNIQLITTFKPTIDNNELRKPDALFSFIEQMKEIAPSAKCRIHFNNKLHGKIYLFEYKSSIKALVTSANLTPSGLNINHEWGVLIDDHLLIEQLKKEIIGTIDIKYTDVSHERIEEVRGRAQSAWQKFKKSARKSDEDTSKMAKLEEILANTNEDRTSSMDDTTKNHGVDSPKGSKDEEIYFQYKILMINVLHSAKETDNMDKIYDAVQFAWKLNPKRAEKADYVLAHRNGDVIGVFVAKEWLKAIMINFPGREDWPERWGFIGEEAPEEIKKLYLGKTIPKHMRGQNNPIRYTYK